MAASATVGILRVLLSADSAEFQAGVAKAASATQQFTKDIKAAGTQSEAVSAAMGKAFTKAEEGTRGLSKAVASLIGFDAIEKANTYAKAVEAIGGVSKLTAVEQAKVNGIIGEATAKYAALGREAPAALTQLAAATKPAQVETSKLTGFMGDLGAQVKASALGFISAQAILGTIQGAFHGLTQFVGESIKAYADQEAAVKRMTTALEAQGQATPEVVQGYQDMAAQFQKTTVNADETINEMQALLVQVGDVMPKDMEKALAAATDLSAGLGVDLRTATLLVGKAFEGETGTLKKYGIVIDETKLKTEGVSAVLDAINQKFGGQAQSEVETYAGKVKQLANAWGEVEEAIGKAIVKDPIIVASLNTVKDTVTQTGDAAGNAGHTFTDFWAFAVGGETALAAEIAISTILKLFQDADSTLSKISAQAKARAPLDLFKGGFGALPADTIEFLEKYASGMEADAESDKKATAAANAHAQAIAGIRKELLGQGAIEAARNYAEAIGKLTNLSKLSTEQQDEVNEVVSKGIEAYKRLGQSAPEAVGRLYAATLSLAKLLQPIPAGLAGIGQAIEHDVLPPTIKLVKVIDGLPEGFEHVGRIAVPTLKGVQQKAESTAEAFNEVGRSLQDIGRFVPGVFGNLIGQVGATVSATAALSKATEDYGRTTQHTLAQSVAYYSGVVSTVIGYAGLVQQAIALITRDDLGGQSAAAISQRGGKAAISAAALTAGLDKTASGLLTTRSLSAFNFALAQFDKAVADSNARLQRYGLTWKDLGDTIQQANIDQISRQLITDWRQLTLHGANVDKMLAGMSDGFSQLVIDAVQTGQKIPVALQPMIETLIRSGKLSEDAARALLGMSGKAVIAFKDVEAAAGRYGIKVEQLGKAVNQLRINDVAKQIIDDWTLLQEAGADTNTVLVGMQKSVQDLVTEALRAGFKIPEGMKPIIKAMIEAGLLIDDNGDKLTDFGSLEFEKPLSQSIDELIAKLQDLIDTFSKVGTSAEEGFGRARGAAAATGQAVPRGSTDTGGGTATPAGGTGTPAETSTPPTGTAGPGTSTQKRRYGGGGIIGRVLSFPPPSGGDRIPILAHEGEAILSAPAVASIGREGFERMNRDWSGGAYGAASSDSAAGGVAVTVSIAINNPTLQSEGQIASLKRQLEDVVVGVLERENATNARGVKTIVRRMVS